MTPPLDDSDRAQIEKYKAVLDPALATARKMMRAINAIHEAADEPAPYPDTDGAGSSSTSGPRSYGPTAFHRESLAASVRRILTDNPNGLLPDTIYEILKSGGFPFEKSNPSEALNSLKISLGKYTYDFEKTKTGYYVLAPDGVKRPRARSTESAKDSPTAAVPVPSEKEGGPQ